jgi:hypothetical protein
MHCDLTYIFSHKCQWYKMRQERKSMTKTTGRDTSGDHIFSSIEMFQLKYWVILLITICEFMMASVTIKWQDVNFPSYRGSANSVLMSSYLSKIFLDIVFNAKNKQIVLKAKIEINISWRIIRLNTKKERKDCRSLFRLLIELH